LTFSAVNSRAGTQQFIERFSAYYTPTIVLMAVLLVIILTLVYGWGQFNVAFNSSLILLVIACPCALVISTPISIFSAIGNASRNGVIIKGGKFIEALARVKVVAMDKTRTLTRGKPVVTDILPLGENTREHLLACAAGIESYSEHPLAQSIIDAARRENITPHKAKNFETVPGKGAKADCVVCYDEHHCVGKLKFIQEEHHVNAEIEALVLDLQLLGKTSILVTTNREVEGVIAVADELKPDGRRAINDLHQLGIKTVMLTGDNHASAQVVGETLRIGNVHAELLPEDKAQAISSLAAKYGTVAMVGDGVNDAPALATADIGISIGAAVSDTAIEASSITILNDRLQTIPYLIKLGRKTVSIIRINTALAVVTKLLFIALAIVGTSSMAMAIFADVGITVIVILNSLRLLSFPASEN
ncbi:MAG: heavy metal translocating P-type ATPase, partial [Pyrinomonadaceae bacterium]